MEMWSALISLLSTPVQCGLWQRSIRSSDIAGKNLVGLPLRATDGHIWRALGGCRPDGPISAMVPSNYIFKTQNINNKKLVNSKLYQHYQCFLYSPDLQIFGFCFKLKNCFEDVFKLDDFDIFFCLYFFIP